MKRNVALAAAGMVILGALSACGGGGGNPGECLGSPEVCAEGDNPNFTNTTTTPPLTPTPSTPSTNSTTTTTTAGGTP